MTGARVAQVVYGPWRLRHGELPPAGAPALRAQAVSAAVAPGDRTCRLPLGFLTAAHAGAANASAVEELPLALTDAGAEPAVAFLLHRLDPGTALFYRVHGDDPAAGSLADRIARLYQARHLQLNNHECFYTRRPAPPVARAAYARPAGGAAGALRAVEAALRGGWVAGWEPRYGAAAEWWDFDELAYRDAAGGLGAIGCYGRRRRQWSAAAVTDVSPAGTATEHELPTGLAARPGAELEAWLRTQFPRTAFAGWRRRRYGAVQAEHRSAGAVVRVEVEDVAPAAGELRVAYAMTRGDDDGAALPLQALADALAGAVGPAP